MLKIAAVKKGAAVVQVCTCKIFCFRSWKLFFPSFLLVISDSQELSHRAARATDPHQHPKTKHLPPRRLQSRKTWRPRCPTRCRTIPPERSASSHPSSLLLFRLPWKQHRQGHTLSQSSQRLLHYCMMSWLNQSFSQLASVLEKKKEREQVHSWKKKMHEKWATKKKLDVLADGGEWHGEACRMEAGGGAENTSFAARDFHGWL